MLTGEIKKELIEVLTKLVGDLQAVCTLRISATDVLAMRS
jgi:hypothetical protein